MRQYFSELLPENLRQLRAYHGYPQKYLAARLKTSQFAYSKMERGMTSLSEERLGSIAAIYQIASFDLLHKSADELIREIIDRKISPPPPETEVRGVIT